MLDLVLRGGQVVDGTGAPRQEADVGVLDGRIVCVGEVDDLARRTLDLDGAVLAPGFVDVHTHYDVQVFWDPALTPSSLHGVTTVIGGNCGFSIAPLSPDSAGYFQRMLARVEGMPLEALEAAVDWNWATMSDYLGRLVDNVGLNVGFMVGHSAIRRAVMGGAASEREATATELDAMRAVLRTSLAAGGLGFSSSIAESHNDADGEPVPSRHASHDELVELAAVCREFPGTSLEMVPLANPHPFPEATKRLMIDMSRRAGRALNWNIVHARAKNESEMEAKLAVSDEARVAGAKVIGLLMPIPIGLRLNFSSGFVLDMLPGWDKLMALPAREKLTVLSNPTERARMRDLAATVRSPYAFWERYLMYDCFTPETKRYEGRTVAEIARDERKDPFDALLDVVVTDDLRTSFGFDAAEPTADDRELLRRKLRDPRVVVGASDAGAHLDMIDTFSYTTYLHEYAVREHQLLTTEEAVHLTTQAPAELVGLRDRGLVREGCCADLVVFHEDTIGRGELHTRADLPSGARRLFAGSTGIDHVFVNGELVVDQGKITDARPGAVLRSGRDTATPAL